MVGELIAWLWRRLRPEEGWLPIALLMGMTGCLAAGAIAAAWTPEIQVVAWSAGAALLLAALLAKRPISALLAWLLLFAYGLLFNFLYLARLFPSAAILLGGWPAVSQQIQLGWSVFFDRLGGWLLAVAAAGASQETLPFDLGVGLLSWFLAAYAGWATMRRHAPLLGATPMGVALALNGYYGQPPVWLVALFVGLMAMLAAVIHFARQEVEWQTRQVDYSDQIRFDLLLQSGALALLLVTVALLLPAINTTPLSRAFMRQPAVQQLEARLEDLFGGVAQPRRRPAGELPAGIRGTMPRSFLLGDPPELRERLVMTATLDIDLPAAYWRGVSYDLYTGRGWAISTERQEWVEAGDPLPAPAVRGTTPAEQSVSWLGEERVTRYTVGRPLRFDHRVMTFWRGIDDLSRAQGEGRDYWAASRLATAAPDQLRQARLEDVPPAILARYTQQPPGLPDRITALAGEVAGHSPTPYDQARSLERFLRQYPYSLEVELPPANRDPVDYFLFELQTGYCDYYASAMAVMARALGLPARIVIGYLAQATDSEGVWLVYENNAHSWVEVYFAGYGWVPFEPTAPFAAPEPVADRMTPAEAITAPTMPESAPPPLPEADRPAPSWRWVGWGLLLALLLALLGWRQRREWLAFAQADKALWSYGRLQRSAARLGRPAQPWQTPAEFAAALLQQLDRIEGRPAWLKERLDRLTTPAQDVNRATLRLTQLFVSRRYSSDPEESGAEALAIWKKIRFRLWLLRWLARSNR